MTSQIIDAQPGSESTITYHEDNEEQEENVGNIVELKPQVLGNE